MPRVLTKLYAYLGEAHRRRPLWSKLLSFFVRLLLTVRSETRWSRMLKRHLLDIIKAFVAYVADTML